MRADWTASGACTSGSTPPPTGGHSVWGAPPRRVRQALSQVAGVVGATRGKEWDGRDARATLCVAPRSIRGSRLEHLFTALNTNLFSALRAALGGRKEKHQR